MQLTGPIHDCSYFLTFMSLLDKSLPLSSSSIIFPTLFRRRQSRRGVTKKEVWGHIGNRQRTSILSLSPFQNRGSNFSLRNSRQAWLFAQTNLPQDLSWFSRTFHFGGLELRFHPQRFPFWIYLDRGSFSGQSNHQMSFCREPSLRLFMFAQRPGKWKPNV